MPKVNVTRKLKCSAEVAFEVLEDVGSYRQFLPFVKESRILARAVLPNKQVKASTHLRITAKKLGLDEKFISEVVFDRAALGLTMKAADGPIKKLDAVWSLKPLSPRQCEITLSMDLSMKSMAMQFFLTGALDFVVRRLFSAFEARALETQAMEAV